MTTAAHPLPYDAPELYDLVLEHFRDDLGFWLEEAKRGAPVLEVPHPATGHPVRMYDTRARDRIGQRQHSVTDVEELDAAGAVARAHRFETTQRWVYRYELELLLRTAGFSRWEVVRGWDRGPFEAENQPMIAYGWRDR